MELCKACMRRTLEENWYVSASDKVVTDEKLCEAHPVMTNRRVLRTLKTMRVWSLEAEGYSVHLTPTCKMPVNLGGGHIHERTARAKLFDYEGPFLDLLVADG